MPLLPERSPPLTEREFQSARAIAARTTRPDTAFAVLVALSCIEAQMPATKLAQLIDVHRSGISLVARELEAAGVLVRTWSPSEKGKARRRGRQRFYALAPSWYGKIGFSTAGAVDDRSPR